MIGAQHHRRVEQRPRRRLRPAHRCCNDRAIGAPSNAVDVAPHASKRRMRTPLRITACGRRSKAPGSSPVATINVPCIRSTARRSAAHLHPATVPTARTAPEQVGVQIVGPKQPGYLFQRMHCAQSGGILPTVVEMTFGDQRQRRFEDRRPQSSACCTASVGSARAAPCVPASIHVFGVSGGCGCLRPSPPERTNPG
ncbi:MAG: hypothetical protein R2873_30360 [Caldilineaceae bacterium]